MVLQDKQRPAGATAGQAMRGSAAGNRKPPASNGSTSQPGRQALIAANGEVTTSVVAGTLYRSLSGSKHFLRRPAGIAFDAPILQRAFELGALQVEVRDRETGRVYTASLDQFWQHGIEFDRGFGRQRVLPFTYWQAERPEQVEPAEQNATVEPVERPGAPRQLELFAGVAP